MIKEKQHISQRFKKLNIYVYIVKDKKNIKRKINFLPSAIVRIAN